MSETKDLQAKEKTEASASGEQTISGTVFSPDVDIFENENDLVLLADMPGVKAEDLDIDLRDDMLTILGKITPYETGQEEVIATEYGTGNYYRRFSLSEEIDQQKIAANLENGVLRLTLPKMEKVKPRRITVNAA